MTCYISSAESLGETLTNGMHLPLLQIHKVYIAAAPVARGFRRVFRLPPVRVELYVDAIARLGLEVKFVRHFQNNCVALAFYNPNNKDYDRGNTQDTTARMTST